MIKIGFELGIEDGWPPFEIEHIWTIKTGNNFLIKNTPFFVRNLSYDDEITAQIDENRFVTEWKTIRKSGYSTVWLAVVDGSDISTLIGQLSDAECQIEAGALEGYFAVGIPPNVQMEVFDRIVSDVVANGCLQLAFASLQHS